MIHFRYKQGAYCDTNALLSIWRLTFSPILRKEGLEKLLVALNYDPKDAHKLGTAAQIYTYIEGGTMFSGSVIEDISSSFYKEKPRQKGLHLGSPQTIL